MEALLAHWSYTPEKLERRRGKRKVAWQKLTYTCVEGKNTKVNAIRPDEKGGRIKPREAGEVWRRGEGKKFGEREREGRRKKSVGSTRG